jgi:hypothetical protein
LKDVFWVGDGERFDGGQLYFMASRLCRYLVPRIYIAAAEKSIASNYH